MLLGAVAAGTGLVVRSWLRELRHTPLEDRVCIVAGDPTGEALVLARHLLWRGARVALWAVNDPGRAALSEALGVLGESRDVMVLACNPGLRQEVEAAVASITAGLGAVDVLVTAGDAGLIAEIAAPGLVVASRGAGPDLDRAARRTLDAIEGVQWKSHLAAESEVQPEPVDFGL